MTSERKVVVITGASRGVNTIPGMPCIRITISMTLTAFACRTIHHCAERRGAASHCR